MDRVSPFKIFGLAETFAVDLSDLKTRYYSASKSLHPDRGSDGVQMEALNQAYETLRDPDRLEEYLIQAYLSEADRERIRKSLGSIPGPEATALTMEWFEIQDDTRLSHDTIRDLLERVQNVQSSLSAQIGRLKSSEVPSQSLLERLYRERLKLQTLSSLERSIARVLENPSSHE